MDGTILEVNVARGMALAQLASGEYAALEIVGELPPRGAQFALPEPVRWGAQPITCDGRPLRCVVKWVGASRSVAHWTVFQDADPQ